jgi:hypothetical protein
MSERTGAIAVVRVSVEVKLSDTWGPETELRQVYKQAEDGAVNKLRRAFSDYPIEVVGKPEVTMVIAERKR